MTNQPIREALEAGRREFENRSVFDMERRVDMSISAALSILSTALAERDERIAELEGALQPMVDAWAKLQTDGAQHINNDPERPSHGMGTIKQKHIKHAASLKESSRG